MSGQESAVDPRGLRKGEKGEWERVRRVGMILCGVIRTNERVGLARERGLGCQYEDVSF